MSVLLAPKGGLAPPGGYVYVATNGRRVVGTSWAQVISRVTEQRALNKQPPGEPAREVYAQFCARSPAHCYQANRVVVSVAGQHAGHALVNRVAGWIAGMFAALYRGKAPLVERNLVDSRVRACRNCAYQEDWRGNCVGCSASLVGVWKKAMKKAGAQSNGLRGCRLLGEDTDLSVWLELPSRNDVVLPKHCWRAA